MVNMRCRDNLFKIWAQEFWKQWINQDFIIWKIWPWDLMAYWFPKSLQSRNRCTRHFIHFVLQLNVYTQQHFPAAAAHITVSLKKFITNKTKMFRPQAIFEQNWDCENYRKIKNQSHFVRKIKNSDTDKVLKTNCETLRHGKNMMRVWELTLFCRDFRFLRDQLLPFTVLEISFGCPRQPKHSLGNQFLIKSRGWLPVEYTTDNPAE